jgi:ABC-type polysaccharide/polyol phosphate export permease
MKLLPISSRTPTSRLNSQMLMAWSDLVESTRLYWFWSALGWHDIKENYRGSILGPFWLTITTAIFVAGLGPLYSNLFSLDMGEYLPGMALGLTIWGFINSTINESCSAFISSAQIIKQSRQPRLALLFRVLWKNLITFAHASPVYLGVLLIYHVPSWGDVCLALLGFLVLCANLIWIGLAVAIMCARFRDITPIIGAIMQIGFFVTPIIWNHNLQPVNPLILYLNPFAALIEIVRAPLIGEALAVPLLLQTLISLCAGYLLTGALFVRCRRKIVFWV